MNRNSWIPMVVIILLACCCAGLVCLGVSGAILFRTAAPQISPVLTELGPVLTQAAATEVPSPAPHLILTPLPTPIAGSLDTFTTLERDVVPPSDLRELAMRLKGVSDIPDVVSTNPANYAVGAEVKFFVSNSDTDQTTQVTAKLAYETDNVYFFVQDGVDTKLSDVQKLVDRFQNQTYPTDREFFGSEWTPGVDGDPHLYMLYTRGLGASVGGYFDPSSEYSHLANPYSNEKEMFVLNADGGAPLSNSYWAGTLAHEFQHMIHWYHHRNGEGWMDEGSSMLAEEINGFDVGGVDITFLNKPDLQLNTWSDLSVDPSDATAHYGAAYLFMKYFLDRFGKEATKALISDQATGLLAVDDTLASLKVTDRSTGKTLTVNDVFADWTIANYLNDSSVGDGRYAYQNYSSRVERPTDTVTHCPSAATSATVHEFGTDYIEIQCTGAVTLSFTGSQQAQLVPTAPHSGRYAFWSNRVDESDTTLTRDFDLSGITAATFDYWAWWQIEQNYDFAYLEVSADGGQTWTIVHTPSGTDSNPTGNNLGWGYTGCSGVGGDPAQACPADWVKESVDLSAYAGKKIKVRFEYVTDAAQNYTSLLLDDFSLPQIDYSCDVEKDNCGWQAEGFARVDNLLPQTFSVQVITISGSQTTVTQVPLNASNQGSLPLDLRQGDRAVLVVSGTTLFSTEPASYQYEIK